MSSNSQNERTRLKQLLASAAGKERRNLYLSIVFTLIVLAVGFGWIAYSANRVVKLRAQEADLKAAIAKAQLELAEQEGLLRKLNADFAELKPTLDKLAEGKATTKQEAQIAVRALSSAQQSLQVALNNPIKIEPTPTPTPVVTTVPNVTQVTFADAEQKVRAAGLTPKRVDQVGKGVPGTVLYQDPIAGKRLPTNSQVTLYVIPTSSASTNVPDVKGMTLEEASQRITKLGLTVRKVDQPGKGVPGTVLYQDPFEGRRVPVGSQVSVYVIPKGK